MKEKGVGKEGKEIWGDLDLCVIIYLHNEMKPKFVKNGPKKVRFLKPYKLFFFVNVKEEIKKC